MRELGGDRMTRPTAYVLALACTGTLAACSGEGPAPAATELTPMASAEAPVSGPAAPRFEIDPLWPKPLPNHWLLGSTIGITVDSRDHVFIIHRPDTLNDQTEGSAGINTPTDACCTAAPPVLEFDPQGALVSAWGGPGDGYDWPQSNHGITVDHLDNLWIGGNGQNDAHILKFSRAGQFLLQLGRPGQGGGSHDMTNFGRVAKISIDTAANEAFVADGYGNKRVAVLDASTGAFKRYWGAYGNPPDDTNLGPYDPAAPPAPQFRNPVHCAEPTPDGLLYVCDRVNNRIQVFQKDGTFVRELRVAPETLGAGSAWDIAFSKDPAQTYIYLADGLNEKIWIIERESMQILTNFGDGGRQPGQFFGVHSIATDSHGNLYSTETYEGKRVQKFVYRGLVPVTAPAQGTLWPVTGT
jgi:DNA-binding beta-propeller fold protein YncE